MELVTAAQEALKTLTEDYERRRTELDTEYATSKERIEQALAVLAPLLNGNSAGPPEKPAGKKYAARIDGTTLRNRIHGYLTRYSDFTVPELQVQLDLTTGGIHGVLEELKAAGYVEETGRQAHGRGCTSYRPAKQYRTTDKWLERCTAPEEVAS